MTRKFQFVAVALAIVIVIGSVPVFARCNRTQQSDGRAEHCPPNCPMMSHATPDIHQEQAITKAPAPRNCCNVSTSRPEAVAQLLAPTLNSVLPVPEVVQILGFEFAALQQCASNCSLSGIGQPSSQVLRI